MKRLVPLFVLILCLVLAGCSMDYSTSRFVEQDGRIYYTSSRSKVCFASGAFSWDGDPNHMEFVIPDTVGGYRVTALGGYLGRGLPDPFRLDMPTDPVDVPDGCVVRDLVFTLRLGRYVEKINSVSGGEVYLLNGEYVRPVFFVICDESNPHLHSVDGVLYSADGQQVTICGQPEP